MNQRVRIVLAALAAVVLAPLGALPAAAAIGDPVTVTGTVTDANGAPIAGAEVSVFHGFGEMESVTTDENGVYSATFTSTHDLEFFVVTTPLGGAMCDSAPPVSAPATVVVDCGVPNLITVTFAGHVTMTDGSDPAGQRISVNDADHRFGSSGEISADGTFEFSFQTPADSPHIDLYGPGMESFQYTGFVDGTVFDGLELVFTPYVMPEDLDMSVTGHVTDRKGRPLEGVQVNVYSGYNGFAGTTDSDGNYTVTGQWPWYDGQFGTDFPVIEIDGVVVDVLTGLNPDSPVVVDYRQGKTPVLELYKSGLDFAFMDQTTDLYRRIGVDGRATWRVCSGGDYCYGFAFGDKRTEFVGVMPWDDFAGVGMALLRDKNDDGGYDWYRFGPDNVLNERATFGVRRPEGRDYFRFQPNSGLDVVEWDTKGGETTIWSWGVADGLEGVQSVVLDGRLVSFDHQDLDGNGADDVVAVTRHGKHYTVYLVTSSTAEPVVVAKGRGEPTMSYEDVDGDGALDVVAAFAR